MLDVVIANYNSTDYLLKSLKSLEQQLNNIPGKIFVQDNGSSDGVDRISTVFPSVVLTKSRENLGFSKAINKGLKQCTNPYVLLLNPNTFIPDGFIETLIRFIESNPDIGIMGPTILIKDEKIQGSARVFPPPLTASGQSSSLSKRFYDNSITNRNLPRLKSDEKSPMIVDWLHSACMIIRKKAIDKVGLLDERFFMYWEDADWCKRMWKAGWKVAYVPQVSVCQYVGGSNDKNVYKSLIEFHKGAYRFFNKHVESSFPLYRLIVFSLLLIRLLFVLILRLVENNFTPIFRDSADF